MDLKWIISEEERTRHDALFYSQKPQDRYLSGKCAQQCVINFVKFMAAYRCGLYHSSKQIFLMFQESKPVLYSYDPNYLYRSSAKSGLYDSKLTVL